MKQNFTSFMMITAMICIFQSCNNTEVSETKLSDIYAQSTASSALKGFFGSQKFVEFQNNYSEESKNLDVSKAIQVKQNNEKFTTFQIPVIRNSKVTGYLIATSVENGKNYGAIFQDMKNFNWETGGVIKHYSAKGKPLFNSVGEFDQNGSIKVNVSENFTLTNSKNMRSASEEEVICFDLCILVVRTETRCYNLWIWPNDPIGTPHFEYQPGMIIQPGPPSCYEPEIISFDWLCITICI